MEAELKNQIIVAATAAKAAGFDGTYEALIEMLKVLQLSKSDRGSSLQQDALEANIYKNTRHGLQSVN
jgi:hypothetical protein